MSRGNEGCAEQAKPPNTATIAHRALISSSGNRSPDQSK
jgi:hypothetical protein